MPTTTTTTTRSRTVPQLLVTTLATVLAATLYLFLTGRDETSMTRARIAERMKRSFSMEIHERRLDEAFAAIADGAAVTIDVDWNVLANWGYAPETPVTLKLKEVTVAAALDALLDQIPADLAWAERGRRVLVSDPAGLANPVVRAYDIEDLLDEYATFRASLPNQKREYFDGLRFRTTDWVSDPSREDIINELIPIIREFVDRDSWVDHGGKVGRIEYAMGCLVVAQNPEAHDHILRILAALRMRDDCKTRCASQPEVKP